MKYRVKIELAEEPADEKGYHSWRDIYEQVVEELNVIDVIKAVNRIRDLELEQQ